jgi:hypothetical protein
MYFLVVIRTLTPSYRCRETQAKIAQLTENDYAVAKADVDRLRQELGQPPLPSLQSTLDEKTSQSVVFDGFLPP